MKKTPATIEKLLLNLELGSSVEASCAIVGISSSTYYHWRSTDPVFKQKAELALRKSEAVWVYSLNEIAADPETPPHVKFSVLKFLLSRRHPSSWSENRVIDLEQDDGLDHFRAMIEQTNDDYDQMDTDEIKDTTPTISKPKTTKSKNQTTTIEVDEVFTLKPN